MGGGLLTALAGLLWHGLVGAVRRLRREVVVAPPPRQAPQLVLAVSRRSELDQAKLRRALRVARRNEHNQRVLAALKDKK